MKEIYVSFISKKLKSDFISLKSGKYEDTQLYIFLNRAINDLKKDPMCGIKIPKKLCQKNMLRIITLQICGNITYLMLGD